MKKGMILWVICGGALILLGGCAGPSPVHPVKTLATGEVPQSVAYSSRGPGTSELLPRGHVHAPPMIPHSIDDWLIEEGENPCLGCHSEGLMDAPKIPVSHYEDPSTGAKSEEIQMSRWSCTLCHAPQADVKPLVDNTFEE